MGSQSGSACRREALLAARSYMCVDPFTGPAPQHSPVRAVPLLLPGNAPPRGYTSIGSFWTQSLIMILVCEIGDRTFFIAAIMAMHRRRITVWQVGCLGPV
jgi:hypothetical protein